MPRIARAAPGGEIYHVRNRAAAQFKMLRSGKDFLAFGPKTGTKTDTAADFVISGCP
jgi:hypothetical protein